MALSDTIFKALCGGNKEAPIAQKCLLEHGKIV